MLRKKYKFFWISPWRDQIRQHHVPAPLVVLVLVLAIVGAVAAIPTGLHYLYEYDSLKARSSELSSLRERNQTQQIEIQSFAQRIASIEEELARIRGFNSKLRALANLQMPNVSDVDRLGVGGPVADRANLAQLLDEDVQSQIRRMHFDLEDVDFELRIQRESIDELKEFLADKASLLASTPSIWPVRGWLSSGFGPRKGAFSRRREFHRGLDIAARTGTAVHAPADGIVVKAGPSFGYGRLIIIDHGYNTKTRFGHLSKILVAPGDRVKRGDEIGLVGSTGRSTGPHLHYEVRLGDKAVDPLKFILD
ncbi:MAG: M23 family metallopeptidase [Myxococcales bacterium]|nr:M23 family metallopeptidase [Myxococcales bacterium]